MLSGASERPLLRSSFNSLDEDHESGRIRGGVGERKVLSEGSPALRAFRVCRFRPVRAGVLRDQVSREGDRGQSQF